MKTLFIWESVNELTKNYHSGGGLVVIADSVESAVDLALKKGVCKLRGNPDHAYPVESSDDNVFIFPDAGCC